MNLFGFFLDFSVFLGFLSKLLRLLLKVTKGTTGHQHFAKNGSKQHKKPRPKAEALCSLMLEIGFIYSNYVINLFGWGKIFNYKYSFCYFIQEFYGHFQAHKSCHFNVLQGP